MSKFGDMVVFLILDHCMFLLVLHVMLGLFLLDLPHLHLNKIPSAYNVLSPP